MLSRRHVIDAGSIGYPCLNVQLFSSSSNQDGLSFSNVSPGRLLSGGILSRGGTWPLAGGLFPGKVPSRGGTLPLVGTLSCVGMVPLWDAVPPGGVVSRLGAGSPVDRSPCTVGFLPGGMVVGGVPWVVGLRPGGMLVGVVPGVPGVRPGGMLVGVVS